MTPLFRVAAVLLVAVAASPVLAQSGALQIRVIDNESGEPVPGATIILSNSMRRVAETATRTDANGSVEFPILPAGGGYAVRATMPGYVSVLEPGVRIPINRTQILVIRMSHEIVERVTVEAKREVVDLEKTETATTFDDLFIENLPVLGRQYTNILTLAPGVQDEDEDGNPNVHGGRERDFKAIVGGVSNVDPLTGLKLTSLNLDSIEEIEIVTAGAGVEYGRAQGGYANIIEKQGSNSFEGLFNFVFRSSKLDGDGATGVSSDRIPEFGWLQPAIQVSGPILKDRLWYRLSHEYIDRDDPLDILGAVAVVKTTQAISSDMITWQASRRNKLSFSFLHDPLRIENVNVSSTTPPESSIAVEFGGPSYRFTWTAPFSPKLLIESTVAYQDSEQVIEPTVPGLANNCVVGSDAITHAQCFDVVTGLQSGSHYLTHHDNRQRFTVRTQADFHAGRFLGMAHRLRLGFISENERYFRTLEQRPQVTFFSARSTIDETPRGIVTTRLAYPEISDARAVGHNWAVYLEDQIKPWSNLTVTLGARVDHEYISSRGHSQFEPEAEAAAVGREVIPLIEAGASDFEVSLAVFEAAGRYFTGYERVLDLSEWLRKQLDIDNSTLTSATMAASAAWDNKRRVDGIDLTNTNVSPFFGVAWDPFKTGKTKIAATAGRHYDKIFLAVPLVELEPVTVDVVLSSVQRLGRWEIESPKGVNPALNADVVDRKLRTPYQDEWTFSLERELAAETAIKLTYIRRKYRDQLQDIDLNNLPGDFGRCMPELLLWQDPVRASVGSGQTILDPYTGEPYTDTDPGIGDGRIDDCVGSWFYNPQWNGMFWRQNVVQRPDGLPDRYVQNPGWGQIFRVGNYNRADYEGLVLEVVRRHYRNWQMNASYTWSEAVGHAEDFNLFLGDDRTILDDEFGYLSYDQRHVLKLNAVTTVPWAGGIRFGTAVQWQSGLPYSVLDWDMRWDTMAPYLVGLAAPEMRIRLVYPTGQRNDQRNESFWNVDMHLAKDFDFRKRVHVQLSMDVFNVMNDNSLRVYGYYNGQNSAVRRFGRQFQLGLRIAF